MKDFTMKHLTMVVLLGITGFAGCRSGSNIDNSNGDRLVISHHYQLAIDGNRYLRQDGVDPGLILGNTGAWAGSSPTPSRAN